MGILDIFKKGEPDFSKVDSNEKAQKLCAKHILVPLYLMPLRFSGQPNEQNTLYVPPETVILKDRYDNMVEKLLEEDKVNGYTCLPEYRGSSFIPCSLTIIAKKDGKEVFVETIQIW